MIMLSSSVSSILATDKESPYSSPCTTLSADVSPGKHSKPPGSFESSERELEHEVFERNNDLHYDLS